MRLYLAFSLVILYVSVFSQNSGIQQALKRNDYDQAILLINKEKRSTSLDVLKARCYKNLMQYGMACQLLEEVLRTDASDVGIMTELADCYQLAGNYSKSRFYSFMAIQEAPQSRFCQIGYLNALYRLKEWRATIQQASSIFRKDSIPALYPLVADCYLQLSKRDSAIWYYQKALKKNHLDYATVSKLARLHWQDGKFASMIQCTKQYMKSDSTNQQINQLNGIGLCLNKEYDAAVERLKAVSDGGDQSFYTHFYLGSSYFAKEDYVDAYEYLMKAYTTDSTSQHLFYYLGKSAVMTGHKQQGIRLLTKGIEIITPKDSVLYGYYNVIANVYETLKNPQMAIQTLKTANNILPSNRLILYRMAKIYDWEIKDPEKALEYYRLFVSTKTSKTSSKMSDQSTVSYYVVAQNRVTELQAELEKRKKKPN